MLRNLLLNAFRSRSSSSSTGTTGRRRWYGGRSRAGSYGSGASGVGGQVGAQLGRALASRLGRRR